MLYQFDRVTSTNTIAWDLIDRGFGDGTIVTARTQTAGRGQWGRTWESERGGLYLSLIYIPIVKLTDPKLITMGTVLGISQVLGKFIPELRIKAPNDLMIDRYKLGGILTETRWLDEKISHVVIGVGINGWNTVPQGAINIRDLNTSITDLDQLREITIEGIRLGKQQWEQKYIENLIKNYDLLTRT